MNPTEALDIAWILIGAALVMLMQGGFCLLECGLSRAKNSINVAIKNLTDFLVAGVLFWTFGFAIMFGLSAGGLVGTNYFGLGGEKTPWLLAFFLFQLAFCGTATTIVSGAVAERIRFGGYLMIAIVLSGLIYPVFGHWAWGGAIGGEVGWLKQLGFIDFAGSSVVHSIGGWVSLAAVILVGPRIGRFDAGKPRIKGHNVPLSIMGVFLLWFGWFGFNGASTLKLDSTVPLVLVNTNLAAAFGGLAGLLASWVIAKKPDVTMVMNGVLAGLVGVTACCQVITPAAAAIVGVTSALVMYAGCVLLERMKIDDVVSAFPVHAGAGAWGTLCVAIFGDASLFPNGATRGEQFVVQATGVFACFIWSFGVGGLCLHFINRIQPLRVTADEERIGLNISEHDASTDLVTILAQMEQQAEAGDFSARVDVEPHTEVGQIAAQYNSVMDRVREEILTREQAVEALRRAEEKYRGIFENAVEGIFQTTPDGRYISANPALARIYGYASVDEMTQGIKDIGSQLYVEPKRREEFAQSITQAGEVRNFVSEVVRADGKRIWISENARVVRGSSGEIEYYEGTVEDITERVVSEQLERERNSAMAANEAKSLFLANMSHEIRTPLNGVIGMLELINRTQLDTQQKRYARIAKSSADALLSLINHILDFSKIEAGKLDLESIDFDLHLLMEDTAEMFVHRAEEKGIELVCHLPTDLPAALVGDPDRLRQVLINLLNNAIKFTEKGEVVLRAQIEEATDQDVMIRFSVADTGIGIPEDRMNRLFRAFSQVDESTTRKYGGTGLGLVICRQLAELMRGEMGVESKIGEGSTFWFTARLRRQLGASEKRRYAPEDLGSLRILGVDDNSTNLEILREQVSMWGFQFASATSGTVALDLMRSATRQGEPFAMAILDRQMPGMNGLQLVKKIKTDPELKATMVLMLTSMDDSQDADRAQVLGVSSYLTKPIRQSRLFDAIIEAATTKKKARAAIRRDPPKSQSAAAKIDVAALKPRILLAEDNYVNQMVAAEILKRSGLSCEVVGNGRLAVEAVTTRPFDIVLMDCQMPEMDGFSATREIRERQSKGLLPGGPGAKLGIIALTANAVAGDRERCLVAGMDHYVTKPIDPEALINAIGETLTGQVSWTDVTYEDDEEADASETVEASDRPGEAVDDLEGALAKAADDVVAESIAETKDETFIAKTSSPGDAMEAVPGPVIEPAIEPAKAPMAASPERESAQPTTTTATPPRDARDEKEGLPPVDVPDLLVRCMDDAEFLSQMLAAFETRLLDDTARLQAAVDACDWPALAREAHALKGATGNLSATSLRQVVVSIESLAKKEDLPAIHPAMARLHVEVERLLAYMPEARRRARQLAQAAAL